MKQGVIAAALECGCDRPTVTVEGRGNDQDASVGHGVRSGRPATEGTEPGSEERPAGARGALIGSNRRQGGHAEALLPDWRLLGELFGRLAPGSRCNRDAMVDYDFTHQ